MDRAPRRLHDVEMLRTQDTLTPGTFEATETDESRLRLTLATNATTSGIGGLAALGFGDQTGSLLGTEHIGSVRLVGAGLVAFAAFVLWVSRSPRRRLRRGTPLISAGDMAWVVATVVTIALGWYSTRGALVMGVVGAAVALFGATQSRLVRRLPSDD